MASLIHDIWLSEVRHISVKNAESVEFATEFRGKEPVVLNGFAEALEWSALGRWDNPTILGGLLAGDTKHCQLFTSQAQSAEFSSLDVNKDNVIVQNVVWAEGIADVFTATENMEHKAKSCSLSGCPECERADACAPSRCYLKSSLRDGHVQHLGHMPDIIFFGPSTTESVQKKTAKVWVGSAGNATPLHFDLCHGVIAQVHL